MLMKFSLEVRKAIYIKFDFKCGQCGSKEFLQIHHLVPNTKLNQKLYGNENIQSEENGYLCCQRCHDKHVFWDKELKKSLIQKWSQLLQRARDISTPVLRSGKG